MAGNRQRIPAANQVMPVGAGGVASVDGSFADEEDTLFCERMLALMSRKSCTNAVPRISSASGAYLIWSQGNSAANSPIPAAVSRRFGPCVAGKTCRMRTKATIPTNVANVEGKSYPAKTNAGSEER